MAVRRATRARAGGGVVIQAFRQGDARVAAGVGAVACAALFALGARLSAGELPGSASLAGLAGVVLLAGGLVLRRGTLATAGLALLGTAYGLAVSGRELDAAAGLFAGGLVLAAELAFWALEPGAAVPLGRAATARRALVVAVVVLAATIGGTVLVLLVEDPVRGGAALGVAGIAGLGAILVLAAVLARSLRGDDR